MKNFPVGSWPDWRYRKVRCCELLAGRPRHRRSNIRRRAQVWPLQRSHHTSVPVLIRRWLLLVAHAEPGSKNNRMTTCSGSGALAGRFGLRSEAVRSGVSASRQPSSLRNCGRSCARYRKMPATLWLASFIAWPRCSSHWSSAEPAFAASSAPRLAIA